MAIRIEGLSEQLARVAEAVSGSGYEGAEHVSTAYRLIFYTDRADELVRRVKPVLETIPLAPAASMHVVDSVSPAAWQQVWP